MMSDKEMESIKKDLRKLKRDAADKDYAISVLKSIGILTKSGKLSKQYKNLCLP